MASRTLREYLSAHTRQSGDCIEWIGSRVPAGYGKARWGGLRIGAHRLSWISVHGAIPDGLCVLHKCDNPPCVNPDHLFLGTIGDNVRDMFAKGRAAQQTRPAAFAKALSAGRLRAGSTRGEQNARHKLTEAQVRTIRERYARGETQSVLASEYGIGNQMVSNIIRGVSWRHAGGPVGTQRPRFGRKPYASIDPSVIVDLSPARRVEFGVDVQDTDEV